MRAVLFKPRHIPGIRPRKPRSARATVIMTLVTTTVSLTLIAGVYLTTRLVKWIWITTAQPTPNGANELPLWTVPVCMLLPVLLFLAVVWRFRLIERFERLVHAKDKN